MILVIKRFSLILLASLLLVACDQENTDEAKADKKSEVADAGDRKGRAGQTEAEKEKLRDRFRSRPVPVAVTSVHRGRVDAYYASTTTLTAVEEAVAVARTQGVVEKIMVEEGDLVEVDQVLAQLDTRKLKLEVERTTTNIRSMQRAYERSKQLFENKMISPDAYDQAQFNLEREQAVLAVQMYDLAEATIRAPISGVITMRYIKLGNTLSPNNPAFEIKRADHIEAILNVPEKELSKLRIDQLARVRIDALQDKEFEGIVERVAPQVDPESGTFRVTVKVDNGENQLKPGMFARVNIRYDSRLDTLLVDRDAIVTQNDESAVFVIKEGLAQRQPVITGHVMGDAVEILQGLAEGDEVVVTGQGGLREGATVRIVAL